METKYCERCGIFLGEVYPQKRYCSECKKEVSRERKRLRYKALHDGQGYPSSRSICQWCGKPMVKMSAAQKYHKDCAKEANSVSTTQRQRLRKELERNRKTLVEKRIPSVGQVQALSDKLGKHYGEVSQMLSTGELVYEW